MKLIKTFFTVICALVILCVFSVCAFGYDNNTIGTAETISVNSYVSGSIGKFGVGPLNSYMDVDYYEFTIKEDGYVSYTYTHSYMDTDSVISNVYLRNSNDGELFKLESKGMSETTSSANIGIKAGTYYISVESPTRSGYDYGITVNYTASDVWEKEFNDNINLANKIELGKSYYGTIFTGYFNVYNSYDIDCYKFELPSKGYITVNFNHAFSDSTSVFAELEILSYDGTNTSEWHSFKSQQNNENTTSMKLGLPAGTYYLRVNQQTMKVKQYDFKINFTPSDNWEINPNGNMGSAMPIDMSKTYYGSLTDNDTDTFSFNLSKDGYVSITFNHAYSDGTSTFANITVYSYDGTNSYDHITLSSKKQSETVTSAKQKLSSGKYYLKVAEYSGSGKEYNFTVNFSTKGETTTKAPAVTARPQQTQKPQYTQSSQHTTRYDIFAEVYETLPDEPVSLGAENADTTYVYENYIYIIVDFEVVICGYAGYDTSDVVPSEIDGMPVTGIAAEAFSGSDIKELEIPSSVTKFGKDALKSHYGNPKIKCEEGSAAEKYALDNKIEFEYVYDNADSESEKGFFDAADVSSNRSILPLLIVAIVVGVATITVIVIFLIKQKKK